MASTSAGGELPDRLTHDAILEAVLDIRFEYDSKRATEIFFGHVALKSDWRGFPQSRNAVADIPESIRRTQADLRYQPSVQLASPDGKISIQIGPQVFFYARRGAYPGWNEAFWPELASSIDHLFEVAPNLTITRLGLRYVNALRSDLHGVNGLSDLAIKLDVAESPVSDHVNINYASSLGSNFETMTRVTTVDLAQGQIPENATVIVDVDVYTTQGFVAKSADTVKDWATLAHIQEKQSFFSVLGKATTERLRADK